MVIKHSKRLAHLSGIKGLNRGRESMKDDERPRQPKTQRRCANVERVRQSVRSDRRLSVRLMAEELNLNTETVRKIFKDDFGTRKISAKMVPRLLSDEAKKNPSENWTIVLIQHT